MYLSAMNAVIKSLPQDKCTGTGVRFFRGQFFAWPLRGNFSQALGFNDFLLNNA